MPFSSHFEVEKKLLVTTLTGRITDKELLSHYGNLLYSNAFKEVHLELVDARAVESWQATPTAQWQLAAIARHFDDQLNGLRVAMVAPTDHIFGMFRMWELQRADLDYEVHVFRHYDQACHWLDVSTLRSEGQAVGVSHTEA